MKAKILIVDDEPEILDILETTLTAEGFEVKKASGGREAIAHCQAESFDLAITDIKMPDMDGLEVMKHLKARDQDMEMIVLTGFVTIDNAIEALHTHGAFDFLRKPLENIEMYHHCSTIVEMPVFSATTGNSHRKYSLNRRYFAQKCTFWQRGVV